jgi:catechol 2,3-dioxygenase-like lactoylglutathione lyase family enzyme
MPKNVQFLETKPVLRIFDEAKAKEFYLGFLGFRLDFEHRFGENFPLYAQISRAGLALHLSGHHGDATPGATIVVITQSLHELHQELASQDYRYNKPHIEDLPWALVMTVTDPFFNRIRFTQPKPDDAPKTI